MKSTSLTSQKSKKTIINVDEIYTYIVIPPDGGWGWVVVLVAFFANFIADGSMTTYGIFKMDIKKSLKCTDSQIILPSSIMTGVYYMAGEMNFNFALCKVDFNMFIRTFYLRYD